MRLVLFTDTLFDVNGVSRFILNIAQQALEQFGPPPDAEHELHVVTSTRFPCPPGLRGDHQTIHNLQPPFATRMPGYANLEVVWPPRARLRALAEQLRPDIIHVSTPGPVGSVGRSIARRLGVPLAGTYHTDFPAYVEHLFNDAVCTWLTTQAMRRFYKPFGLIFSRSDEYAASLVQLGVRPERIVRLRPGIDTRSFASARLAPDSPARHAFWGGYSGVRPESIKFLYVGRVSVEKNLPFLARVWRGLHDRGNGAVAAELIVVGDGPYRARMEQELAGTRTTFLGFRYGQELSRLYGASDVFVFPSLTDTLGQVVMEAQAAGLPVIVTDQGGPSEVVNTESQSPLASASGVQEPTGIVVPWRGEPAVEGWLRAIRSLLSDGEKRRRMGDAAARAIAPLTIAESFRHFWAEHEAVVRSALDSARTAGRSVLPRPASACR